MSSFIEILSGFEAQSAAKEEESAIRKQGGLALRESEQEAARVGEANTRFEQRQRLSFLKSGVRLEGTPLAVLAETRAKGARETSAIRERGVAQAGLLRTRAGIVRSVGRAKLLSTFGSATARESARSKTTEPVLGK